jgi:hypothetical protein
MAKGHVDSHYKPELRPPMTPGQLEYIAIIQANVERLLRGAYFREAGVGVLPNDVLSR